jgi:F-type H+-transporting ATPase subunit delta
MSEAITAARPYAQAVFDEAQKQKDLKGWSEVLNAGAVAVADPQAAMVIASPRVSHRQLEDMMMALCGVKPGSTQGNFIRLLVENRRLELLPEIAGLYETLRAEAEKSLEVTVTSAFELSEAQKQKITEALKKRMNRAISLDCRIDKQLLGGVVIRAGDKVIDGSVHARLGEMANALA